MHEVLRDDAALDVAVMAAADAQNGLVSADIELASHLCRRQLGLQSRRRCFRIAHGVQVQAHAIGNGSQRFGIHEIVQTFNYRFGQLVLACQLGQRIAADDRPLVAAGMNGSVDQGDTQQKSIQRTGVLEVKLFFAGLDLVQRRLGNVDVAPFHQVRHLAVEKGQQQGADVGAIHVGIGHDDDTVVTQLVDVEVVHPGLAGFGRGLADASAQCRDQRHDFIAGQQLFVARFFHVQNLAAQRQDGLEFPVATLLGRAASGVALDDVDLAQ